MPPDQRAEHAMSADRPPHDRRRDTHAEECRELAGARRELFARIHRAHPETIIDLELANVTRDATTPEPEDQQPEAQRRPDRNPGRGGARSVRRSPHRPPERQRLPAVRPTPTIRWVRRDSTCATASPTAGTSPRPRGSQPAVRWHGPTHQDRTTRTGTTRSTTPSAPRRSSTSCSTSAIPACVEPRDELAPPRCDLIQDAKLGTINSPPDLRRLRRCRPDRSPARKRTAPDGHPKRFRCKLRSKARTARRVAFDADPLHAPGAVTSRAPRYELER